MAIKVEVLAIAGICTHWYTFFYEKTAIATAAYRKNMSKNIDYF